MNKGGILMPELPDLEVFRINVFNQLTSKHLCCVENFSPKKVHIPSEVSIDSLAGEDLQCINRVGKELFFDFGNHKIIAVHLMLSGQISIVSKEYVNSIAYKIFAMHFENESIVFSDKGGLCTVTYLPVTNEVPDAFDATFTLEYFLNIAKMKPRAKVKAFLIDQNIVKGIGNAYADEILWNARISPKSLVGKIPEDKLTILYHTIGVVLNEAIAAIKRISPNIISGEERSFLKVHNKAITQTETGHPIIVEKISSKTTYYTEEQILYS